jgi:hypothetical protein
VFLYKDLRRYKEINMAKVRCNICANEVAGICKIKKIGVKVNKPRKCEAYIYEETKVKERHEVPVRVFNYTMQQEVKKERKIARKKQWEELRAIRKMMKEQPGNKTAQDLGLITPDSQESKIITPGDRRFSMPTGDEAHSLTGDLSRFITTANDGK